MKRRSAQLDTGSSSTSRWNPNARLGCMTCNAVRDMGPAYLGCPQCHAPLEVIYDWSPQEAAPNGRLDRTAAGRLLQPLRPGCEISLGRCDTPLVELPGFRARVYLKNESISPTWAHKDRYHAVAVGSAVALSANGVVTTSTGNHGASAAAHAASAGLRSVVLCHRDAPAPLLDMIYAFGGIPAQLPEREHKDMIVSLVDEGWFPATSIDPNLSGRANPYGAEGYKHIAYELAEQLGGLPDAVIIPTASGDTLYGVAKGLAEVSKATGSAMPRVIAGQPSGANPLVQSIAHGYQVALGEPATMALSVGDGVTGRHAIKAIERWNGMALAVDEVSIAEATRKLAKLGYYLEPASALPLAIFEFALESGLIGTSDRVVLVATSSGTKWPETMAKLMLRRPVIDSQTLMAALARGTYP